MARQKEEVISMVDTFQEFKELKNIDRSTMISVLEDSFRSVLAKMFETDENFDIIINPDKGDFEIWKNRTVVADGEVLNENMEVALSEAQKTVSDIEISALFISVCADSAGEYVAYETDSNSLIGGYLQKRRKHWPYNGRCAHSGKSRTYSCSCTGKEADKHFFYYIHYSISFIFYF